MKAKLIKTDSDSYHNGHYFLNNEEGFAIGSTDYEWCRRVASVKPQYKLSKENCDKIFGVVDVEKLAEKEYPTFNLGLNSTTSLHTIFKQPFINGFNKAMELNKDKLFTLEDMQKAFELGHNGAADTYMLEKNEQEFEKLIQQPTEIEVEILCLHTGDPEYTTNTGRPKLDEDGCLILRKITS